MWQQLDEDTFEARAAFAEEDEPSVDLADW